VNILERFARRIMAVLLLGFLAAPALVLVSLLRYINRV
jgi:hypothetical protein